MFGRITRAAVVLAATGLASVGAYAVPQSADVQSDSAMTVAQANDSMTSYRNMAADTLAAFKAGDKAGAKAKARSLEKAWDTEQNALKSKSPDTWKAVDDAMDAFIKPLMKGGSPDGAKVQAAYDDFIAKLDMAAKM